MNRLYEISNQGDVMLSFNGPVSVNGHNYAPNEPCLFLENVLVKFNYYETDALAKAQGNVVSYQHLIPRTITLSETSLTTKICDLMLARKENTLSVRRRIVAMGNDDCIYLSEGIDAERPIFVYNKDGSKVEGYSYDPEFQCLNGTFDATQKFVIYYYAKSQGDQYGLESESLPYMNMQITLKGNTDKQAGKTILYFPAVVMNAVPVFAGTYGSVLSVPLTFDVVNKNYGGKPQVVFN